MSMRYPDDALITAKQLPAIAAAITAQAEPVGLSATTKTALATTYVPQSSASPRLALGINAVVTPTGATTPGSGDIVGIALSAKIAGNLVGVPSYLSTGMFFGVNSYVTTGSLIGDAAGLNYLYGNLLEAVVKLPIGAQTIAAVDGLAAQAAFSDASAGSTVSRMTSMHVIAPARKDGAVAGTATEVYGLVVDQATALGASTKVRSVSVTGDSQFNALFITGAAATGATVDTVGGTVLTLTANSTGTGAAPQVLLFPGTDTTRPSEIQLTTTRARVSGEVRVDGASSSRFSIGDNIGADTHPGGNAVDWVMGGLRGFTHYGTNEAASVEFRSIFTSNAYKGGDVVLVTRDPTTGNPTDVARAKGDGTFWVNTSAGFRWVQVGAVDSGGTGFRMLRVAN